MKKRYCVTYVGNDSRNHRAIVWATDHDAAIRRVSRKGVDMVVGVRRKANPFVVLGIIVAAVVLILIEIVH